MVEKKTATILFLKYSRPVVVKSCDIRTHYHLKKTIYIIMNNVNFIIIVDLSHCSRQFSNIAMFCHVAQP